VVSDIHKSPTLTWHNGPSLASAGDLFISAGELPESVTDLSAQYQAILKQESLAWVARHQLIQLLGSGTQGMVYLSSRQGADNFCFPVALKVFSPERYPDQQAYEEATLHMGRIAMYVARIQQDNLLNVQNWVEHRGIRCMVMEWVEGHDLRYLTSPGAFDLLRMELNEERWQYLNQVVVTEGPVHSRLKAGIALAVIRDCLGALSALHRASIIHGDLKPANIMLKRSGNAKLIDLGSAFLADEPPLHRTWTPAYAAPEVHRGENASPCSDLVSLGYVLVELLSGQPPVSGGPDSHAALLEAKQSLPDRLPQLLPAELSQNETLMTFCRRLVSPDPEDRFPSAEDADLGDGGAASIQRQLVKMDLASEYANEIRLWLQDLV
jgi:eukaryotic-like serine/threonine-protein kinase